MSRGLDEIQATKVLKDAFVQAQIMKSQDEFIIEHINKIVEENK